MKILNYYKYLFALSGVILVFGVVALFSYGLKLGIDFKGGTITELGFTEPYDIAEVRQIIVDQGIHNAVPQPAGNNGLIIKTEVLEKEQHDKLLATFKEKVGEFEEKRYESIGPVIGQELKRNSLYQLILVSFGIVVYIAYAFRR